MTIQHKETDMIKMVMSVSLLWFGGEILFCRQSTAYYKKNCTAFCTGDII